MKNADNHLPSEKTTLWATILVFGCFVQGVIGFGFVIVASILFLALHQRKTDVLLYARLGFWVNLFFATAIFLRPASWANFHFNEIVGFGVAPLLFGAFIGFEATRCSWARRYFTPETKNRWTIILALAAAILFVALKFKSPTTQEPSLSVSWSLGPLAGILTGFLHRTLGVSGLPLILYLQFASIHSGYVEPAVWQDRFRLESAMVFLALNAAIVFLLRYLPDEDEPLFTNSATLRVVVGSSIVAVVSGYWVAQIHSVKEFLTFQPIAKLTWFDIGTVTMVVLSAIIATVRLTKPNQTISPDG